MVVMRFRQCTDSTCRLRYPLAERDPRGLACPRCGKPTTEVAAVARHDTDAAGGQRAAPRRQIAALLDNVRSLYNVGSIFRTADGAGIRCLHLCGITPTPENPKLAKTALGAERSIDWRYHPSAVDAVQALHADGYRILALETQADATSLSALSPVHRGLLIVGNEIAGIDPGVLALADECVAIPMAGVKGSLNVATAFGVAAYALMQ